MWLFRDIHLAPPLAHLATALHTCAAESVEPLFVLLDRATSAHQKTFTLR